MVRDDVSHELHTRYPLTIVLRMSVRDAEELIRILQSENRGKVVRFIGAELDAGKRDLEAHTTYYKDSQWLPASFSLRAASAKWLPVVDHERVQMILPGTRRSPC